MVDGSGNTFENFACKSTRIPSIVTAIHTRSSLVHDVRRGLRRGDRMLPGVILAIFCLAGVAVSQEVPGTQERSSLKIPVFEPTSPDSAVVAATYVSIEPGIDRLLRGDDPRDLKELKALQRQQSKVAEKVHRVTVNLQHGSTQGSGVMINEDGYILTAAHVAGKPKQRITVVLHDGRRVEGISMGVNRDNDAGLVRILKNRDDNNQPWAHAALPAMDERLNVGQWCIAGGHPGGVECVVGSFSD